MECSRVLFLLECALLGSIVSSQSCQTPDQADGVCIKISDCEPMVNFITNTKNISNEAKGKLIKYFCGFDKERVKVCCPLKTFNIETTDISDEPVVLHRNFELLPPSCGPVPSNKRLGENTAMLFDYRWTALLKYDNPANPYICGGSLISNRYVLTAAHCVQNKHNLLGIRLGEYDLRTEKDCTNYLAIGIEIFECVPPAQDFTVSRKDVIVHPEYDANTLTNDIALIRLRKTVNFDKTIVPVCLPIRELERTPSTGKYTTIGWGTIESGYSTHVLKHVSVPQLGNTVCDPYLYNLTKKNLVETQFCTDSEQQGDPCVGDDGGSLVGAYTYFNGSVFKIVQYGIVSLRPSKCDDAIVPVVYTKVGPYVEWILDNIRP